MKIVKRDMKYFKIRSMSKKSMIRIFNLGALTANEVRKLESN